MDGLLIYNPMSYVQRLKKYITTAYCLLYILTLVSFVAHAKDGISIQVYTTGSYHSYLRDARRSDEEPYMDTVLISDRYDSRYLTYARQISSGDIDFMATITHESRWDIYAVGDGGDSHWLCQTNRRRHWDTVYNGTFRHEYREQLDRCRSKRNEVPDVSKYFYAYKQRWLHLHLFDSMS